MEAMLWGMAPASVRVILIPETHSPIPAELLLS